MVVIEFVCQAKPGHFAEVSERYSKFAADFLSAQDELETVVIFADEAAGEVHGMGLYDSREAAEAVSSNPQFAEFNDAISSLLNGPPERREYSMLHLYTK